MAVNHPRIILTLAASLLISACGANASDELPPPIQNVANQGVEIKGSFEGPDGMTGYVGEFQGQGLAIYATADGQNAFVGTWIDSDGRDMGAAHIRRLIDEPRYADAWVELEQANWIQEGSDDAEHTLYTFTDPFCPYCRQMHESMKPYIESGQVQLRHIMVGIIREASPSIAATILGSDDPAAALSEHMSTFDDGGILMQGSALRQGNPILQQNHSLMRSLNLSSTPATFFKDQNDVVQMVQGAPNEQAIEAMLHQR
ncbi:thiol:disulfide interchange protein DsbG [Aliidiomarina sedimenti]|uniref:Thiol:disulfide interchange protein n=1 Tax=Aliidiomarina sedimenti TaxID=1933879 RepID=A0ABY0BX71_9GAMM|nr:thiol:disulfide interchange protein DsbG [Aliidiomarina sedimenti]RUO28975.1 thiol:disulfide interchange protein DsbG [Aliidiomarina sedimenti]